MSEFINKWVNTKTVFFGGGGNPGFWLYEFIPHQCPVHLQVTCICHGNNIYFPKYSDFDFKLLLLSCTVIIALKGIATSAPKALSAGGLLLLLGRYWK